MCKIGRIGPKSKKRQIKTQKLAQLWKFALAVSSVKPGSLAAAPGPPLPPVLTLPIRLQLPPAAPALRPDLQVQPPPALPVSGHRRYRFRRRQNRSSLGLSTTSLRTRKRRNIVTARWPRIGQAGIPLQDKLLYLDGGDNEPGAHLARRWCPDVHLPHPHLHSHSNTLLCGRRGQQARSRLKLVIFLSNKEFLYKKKVKSTRKRPVFSIARKGHLDPWPKLVCYGCQRSSNI